jgi:excisionase family DNA binding protein
MALKTEIPVVAKQDSSAAGSQSPAADRLLTINEVAEMTGLAVGTLYHFVSQKRIPVVRLSKRCIRFRQSDLADWVQTLTQETD